jgi:hypothetical protein
MAWRTGCLDGSGLLVQPGIDVVALLSALFFGEVALFGAAPVSVGGISVRNLLLLTAVAACVVQMVTVPLNRKRWVPLLVVWAVFVAVWGLLLPALNGTPFKYALADVAPVASLPLCLFVAESANRRAVSLARSVCFGAVLLLAVCLLAVTLFARLNEAATMAFLMSIPGLLHIEGQAVGVFFITPDEGGARVYTSTMGLILVGIHHANTAERGRPALFRLVLIALFVLAVAATATRGLALAILVYFLCFYVLRRQEFSSPHFPLYSLRLLGSGFVLSFGLLLLLSPAFLQALGLGRPISDDIRADLLSSLVDSFLRSPATGHGFGYVGAMLRSETAPYSYELSNLTLLTKVGVIGISVLTFMWGCYAALFFAEVCSRRQLETAGLLALCIGAMMATATNPHFSGAQLTCFFIYVSIELAHARARSEASRAHLPIAPAGPPARLVSP